MAKTLPENLRIGIVGVGNSASALACYLGERGYRPLLFMRDDERVPRLAKLGCIRASGELEGVFPIGITTSAQEFCASCDLIFLATQATDYLEVMDRLHAYLRPCHRLVLFSGKFAGSLEVTQFLRARGVPGVAVLETDALFACRSEQLGSVWIRGIKKWTLYSGPSRSITKQNGELFENLFPGLEPAENLIQRGLTDFGALAHPLTVLVNMNEIDRQRPFLFYYEGYTERTITLLEQVEQEFRAVANAYGTSLIPARELLSRYYGGSSDSLLEAMRSVPNYRYSQSPKQVHSRYLLEDVPCTLVPVSQLARLAGLATPLVDSIVSLSSALLDIDFRKDSRTLARLGWEGLSQAGVLNAMSL